MESKDNWHKANLPKTILTVVADATINNSYTAQGKTIPLVILDTTSHPEIDKAIELHRDVANGNCFTIWGKLKNEKFLTLSISILEPSPVDFTIFFSAQLQAHIVDLVVSAQMLYIQAGKPGDRLKHDLEKPKILIEVPSEKFSNEWKVLYLKIIAKSFINIGFSKTIAKKFAQDFYNEMRVIREMRIKK